MAKKKKVSLVSYKSDAAAAVHETMSDLRKAGIIDKQTMRHFDDRCLTKVESFTAAEIFRIRKRAGVSQAIFAGYLNVRPNLVSAWERGERKPSGPARKLLTLAKHKGLEAIA